MHIEQDGVLLPNPYVVSLDQQELRVKSYHRVGSGTTQPPAISSRCGRPAAPCTCRPFTRASRCLRIPATGR